MMVYSKYDFVVSFSFIIYFQGFVGILGVNVVMFVWDQCFMFSWVFVVMENICFVLLQLLRGYILYVKGYISIRRVLLDYLCELFMLDIQ